MSFDAILLNYFPLIFKTANQLLGIHPAPTPIDSEGTFSTMLVFPSPEPLISGVGNQNTTFPGGFCLEIFP